MSKYSDFRDESGATLKTSLGEIYGLIKDRSKVLDVGCSTGYFGGLLIEDKKAKVDGIELNLQDAKIAKKILGKVYSFDLESDKWPEGLVNSKYDVIFFGDVLEHLKDPGKVLIKMKRLLKHDGSIVISIPNIAHASIRMELLAGNFEYEKLGILDETHLKYFTFNSLIAMLDGAGYKIEAIDQSTISLPRKTLAKLLKDVGLKPTEKFYKFMSRPDATAFQYKVLAKVGRNDRLPKLGKKPLQLAKMHMTEIDELHDQVRFLSNELNKVRAELYPITTSPLWTVRNKIRRHFRKVKKGGGK